MSPGQSDVENEVRWRPKRSNLHVESHFLKANDPRQPRAFWLKYTILARPGQAPQSQIWALAFTEAGPIGAKKSLPALDARHRMHPFRIEVPDFTLESGQVRGQVQGSGHHLRFDLRHTAGSAPFRPFPWDWMYTAGFPRFKVLTPFPHETFTGTLEVDGQTWQVQDWPGMQGHNWGKAHSERYAWAHCNHFAEAPASWFEGFSAQIRVGGVTTPFLTLTGLYHEGRLFRPFSPRSFLAPVQVEHTRWTFRAPGRGFVLSGEVSAEAHQMAGLVYENPTGPPSQCLNSKLAQCRIRLERPGQPTVELHSQHGAALEILVRETSHPVRMLL